MSDSNDFNRTVIEEFRANGGKVTGQFAGAPMILVTHTGAKSGKEYTTPLVHTTDGDIPLGESVGRDHVVALGAAPEGLSAFRWPIGVLPELGDATAALAGARRGWTVRSSSDAALLVIEAQTDAPDVGELLLGLVERLPSADNLEVRVLDHFDRTESGGATDVWLTSRVNVKKIMEGKSKDLDLSAGDIVMIPSSKTKVFSQMFTSTAMNAGLSSVMYTLARF